VSSTVISRVFTIKRLTSLLKSIKIFAPNSSFS
jgi:hypothetical protein